MKQLCCDAKVILEGAMCINTSDAACNERLNMFTWAMLKSCIVLAKTGSYLQNIVQKKYQIQTIFAYHKILVSIIYT